MSVCSILSTVRGPLYLRIISASCSSMAPLEPHRPTWDPPDPACLETIKRNKQEFWRKRTHVRKHLASWTATGKVLDSWTATEQIYIYIYIHTHTNKIIYSGNESTNKLREHSPYDPSVRPPILYVFELQTSTTESPKSPEDASN